ncbi:hypothetical protein F442_01341 [Phytophthora nicotianae P10297]|uniref:Uncharacterized protein n=6 Tax=Phytophthora nicotianae TaxID=4792 RepID=V9FGP4_PHYNI|nr:hypothetical protein F443_06144 [Phytophthora nicotianae P1569]ETO84717.1 hypothetical protein F444_01396 [Phytophthora nicotianae P1976]ETP53782.1 hypothetical protein F442_01341 [Phytophthora nicotianae P10297]
MAEEGGTKKNTEKKKTATRGKAWGEDEVHVLISAWKSATLRSMPVGSTAKMLNQVIYNEYLGRLANRKAVETGSVTLSADEFKTACATEGPEGGLDVCDSAFRPLSLRSTEAKVASLKQSFSLISDHNNGSLVGSTGRPAWFQQSQEECAAVLKKWKRVAFSEASYTLLSDVFEDDPSINAISGGVSLGSGKRSSKNTSSVSGSAQKKRKTEDLAKAMQAIMDGAVNNMRAIAAEDQEHFIQHQKEENERNRELLRTLFGKE